MVEVSEFRRSLVGADPIDIVDRFLLSGECEHISNENIDHIASVIAQSYKVERSDVSIYITGSTKLGFSIVEKNYNEEKLHRYRKYSPVSDIDVCVISPKIFDMLWLELSIHHTSSPWFPNVNTKLGNYLVSGWLRPDHFPRNAQLFKCDLWWDVFRRLSNDKRFGRRKVRGGAFYSLPQVREYLCRAVRDCIALEESNENSTHEQESQGVNQSSSGEAVDSKAGVSAPPSLEN